MGGGRLFSRDASYDCEKCWRKVPRLITAPRYVVCAAAEVANVP
jgi:hypothetical protein